MINEKQCRSARAWLGLSQEELAERSKVSARTIAHFEAGNRVTHDGTLRDLREVLEKMGIVFVFEGSRGVGIRMRPTEEIQAAKTQTKK